MKNDLSVTIIQNPQSSPTELLVEALERSGFWLAIAKSLKHSAVPRNEFQVLIKPDLGAFDLNSPAATDPALVEKLIDLLNAKGYSRAAVCAAPDSGFLWAENRDVPVLADLLGYKYVTPGGHEYDVFDLSEDLVPAPFPASGVLEGTELSRSWITGHFRICFAKNKTDEADAYALCLDSMLGVLPLIDKDYYYRRRVPAGAAVCDLLRTAPVHFALIDAVVSAHGMGGSRSPVALETHCMIASENALLADYAGALKMGLDPHRSQLADSVLQSIGLPSNYTVDGDLTVYPGWLNVHPLITDSHRRREKSTFSSRLIKPWLQELNAELFPLKNPIDAKVHSALGSFFADVGNDAGAFWLLVTVNNLLGNINEALETYRILFNKDALRQVHAPLGFNLEEYSEPDYRAIIQELLLLEPLLERVEPAADGLRWRFVDGATVFEFTRDLHIPFKEFVQHVDVSRTIQHMNDYIGGVVVPVQRDGAGRVFLQAERNLYLPQPNYLALYQGKPIDVSKIEVCEYSETCHRMFWKTVKSENDSAICDDGVVTFVKSGQATRVQIVGKQHFVLPPFWQAVNLDLAPDFKATLVTHAYKTFFERTYANFEALVEGRDIRIGRPWHTPGSVDDTEPLPVEVLQRLLTTCGEKIQGFLGTESIGNVFATRKDAPVFVDDQGFKHFRPSEGSKTGTPAGDDPGRAAFQAVAERISEFYGGLLVSFARDGLGGGLAGR